MTNTTTFEVEPDEIQVGDTIINPDGSESVVGSIWDYEDGESFIEFDVEDDTIGLYLENTYTIRRGGES